MKIEIKNFSLVSRDNLFDLYEKAQIEETVDHKKTGKKIEKVKCIAYDMNLETGISYILDRTVNDQDLKVDLSTYLKIYQKERETITNLLKK